jgi:hypothetical protein
MYRRKVERSLVQARSQQKVGRRSSHNTSSPTWMETHTHTRRLYIYMYVCISMFVRICIISQWIIMLNVFLPDALLPTLAWVMNIKHGRRQLINAPDLYILMHYFHSLFVANYIIAGASGHISSGTWLRANLFIYSAGLTSGWNMHECVKSLKTSALLTRGRISFDARKWDPEGCFRNWPDKFE